MSEEIQAWPEVMLTPEEQRLAKRAALPEHLQLGLTLAGMRELGAQLPCDAVRQANAKTPRWEGRRVGCCAWKGPPKFPKNKTLNGYVNKFFVTCWEEKDGNSVCERLKTQDSPHVGKATVFVSWFLDTPIATLLDALANFLEQQGLREEDTFFWVCDYVIRQTDVHADLEWLGDCVSAIGHTVLLMEQLHDPHPLKRAYCIKEVYHTQASGAAFDVVMSTEHQQKAYERALVRGFASVMAGLSQVDVRQVCELPWPSLGMQVRRPNFQCPL